MFDKFIENKLGGYKHQINYVDNNLPLKLEKKKSVAVVGGGIAGLITSTILAERGFDVTLFEKEKYLGGKIGSWPVKFDDGFETRVEHGFHGFFKQYYNLRDFLKKINSYKHLIPIEDYLILTQDKREFRFREISKTPVANIFSLARRGVFKLSSVAANPSAAKMIDLLKYDSQTTFTKWDNTNFEQFAKQLKLPKELQLVFETFARAFFADKDKISMGELIKSFHFYFLSNNLGLLYDVLEDDFYDTFINKILDYNKDYNLKIVEDYSFSEIKKQEGKFLVSNEMYDYMVLATDIKGTKSIVDNSDYLNQNHPSFYQQIKQQKISQKYAVLRIWTDKKIPTNFPFFIFTEALQILDSITIYHDMEISSRKWAKQTGGGIYELHSYAVKDETMTDEEIRNQLLTEFYHYLPEMKNSKILYEYLQVRDDFTAFHTGLYKNRPSTKTEVDNLYLAGDWVKLETPAMLMEAAASSALFAVNEILLKENLRNEKIYSVPLQGLL